VINSLLILFLFLAQANESAPNQGGGAAENEVPHKEEAPQETGKEVVVKDMGGEVWLPSKLFELIEEDPSAEKPKDAKTEKKSDFSKMGSLSMGGITFTTISVKLWEKTPGVLKNDRYTIQMPVGGGEIDLSQYTTGKKGTFFVDFRIDDDLENENLEVYFVSKGRKRKIDGQIWGAGCKKILDISNFFKSTIHKGLFSVNTTDSRHLTVLGGHFVFAAHVRRQIRTAQITFKDSQKPEYFCPMGQSKFSKEDAKE
jgi:hypothetical protein